jgi:hypothetical protein
VQCPALLVPQTYGLVKGEVHPKTHRTLILIAKVLQNLANKNDFSGKEEFMESMNGFIHRNITKVRPIRWPWVVSRVVVLTNRRWCLRPVGDILQPAV